MQRRICTFKLALLFILGVVIPSGCSVEYVRVTQEGLYFVRYAYRVPFVQSASFLADQGHAGAPNRPPP